MSRLRHYAGPNESYSLAVQAGDFVYLAGHVGSAPEGGGADAPFDVQVRRAFDRLFATLDGLGLGVADLVKVNVFLADVADFEAFNQIYRELIPVPRPARTTVQVAIAHGWRFEVDAIALARAVGD